MVSDDFDVIVISSDEESYEDDQTIRDWHFTEETDSEDEDFDADEDMEQEGDFEAYVEDAHSVPAPELVDLAEDLNRPPKHLQEPDAALEEFPSEEEEEDDISVQFNVEDQAAELSDVELELEDIPDEPPLDINPDDVEVRTTLL